MNTPPFLLGLTLLFWGWQTGFLAIGVVLGILIEIPRIVKARWNFSQSDFDRLWNLCAVIFVGAAVYLFIDEGTISFKDFFVDAGRRPEAIREKGRAALIWFQWLPMLFFPFAIAAAFSEDPSVCTSTFSWFLRKRRSSVAYTHLPRINVAFPYFAITLFAAASSSEHATWFYTGFCALVGWALWSQRTRRFPVAAWCLLFGVAAIGGHFSHHGIVRIEKAIEDVNVTWFSQFAGQKLDVKQSRTRMGSIGDLKLSDRIVLRLRTDGQPPPSLLREASYNIYRVPYWLNPLRETNRVLSDDSITWKLLPNKPSRRIVRIGQYLDHGTGILPAPNGVSQLEQLPAEELEHSPLGAIRVKGSPGLVIYQARYDDGATIDAPPKTDDLSVDADHAVIDQVAREIGLSQGMEPVAAMRLVERFFAEKFSYSSYLTKGHVPTAKESALARFLLKERTGHCEYFATATTLLLRKAGVPARYAIGYSVQEGSGKKYVVRELHAHAWALAYYENAWHDFDTTPGSWHAAETGNASLLQPFRDFFSDLWFQFSKWRWNGTEWRRYFVWVPAPLVAIALASFFLKKQWKQIRPGKSEDGSTQLWPGFDSELYAIERAMANRGLDRQRAESWPSWLQRIDAQAVNPAVLRGLVTLHTKYRFDPNGLTHGERAELRENARDYLKQLKRRYLEKLVTRNGK